jgi:V8-like Glu-specific endopeptidase/tetratricopeptide (TPR) repeat protein
MVVILGRLVPGQDGRRLVNDTTTLPFSAHGRIIIYFEKVEAYASGTLISPRHVLTAACNLYSHQSKSDATSIFFIPGLNGVQKPYGVVKAKRWFYPHEYRSQQIEDYGLIELEEDVGESSGFIEMKVLGAEEIDNLNIFLYGYPTYMDGERNFSLYGMRGRAKLNDENLLIYEIDTNHGQDGSCIYYYCPEDCNYYTIGVHVRGFNSHNEGIFLTTERIDQIQKWLDDEDIKTKGNLVSLTTEIYGRDSELSRLRNSMRPGKELSVVALSGVAGIGKSIIALKFSSEAIGAYHYIWWIDSTNKATFRNSVNALADAIGIIRSNQTETIDDTKAYLNSSTSRFLLIFDNLQDEQLVEDFIMTRGHFIITTQLSIISFEKIEVGSLSSKASVELLSNQLFDRADEELESLAYFFQGYPLALYQSAYCISKADLKVSDYIQNFSKIVGRDPKLKNILSNSIKSLSEESRHILKIVCLGDSDNIPYDTLYGVFRYSYPHTSQYKFDYYIEEIARFSILSYNTNKGTFKIYRVIHEVSIFQLSSSIDDSLIQNYSDYLYNHYNTQSDIYTREEIEQIKNLTIQASRFLTSYKNKTLSARDILNYSKLAISYFYFYNDDRSTIKCLQIVEHALNYTMTLDSDLAQVYNNLGLLYNSRRDYVRSENYYLRCLAFKDTDLAENDKIVAKTYKGLGDLYLSMADCTRSEEHYLRCLEIRESILPSTHPDLAQICNSLGTLYQSIGDFARSEKYYLRCLAIREYFLPGNHPGLAQTYNILGSLYLSMGVHERSEEYYLRSLRIMKNILPEDDPNLAKLYSILVELYNSIEDANRV